MKCSFCKRDIPEELIQYHHLVPKSKDGKDTIPACGSCHNFIHKTWENNRLRDFYNSVESIRSTEEYQRFVKWLLKHPVEKVFKTDRKTGRDKNPYR